MIASQFEKHVTNNNLEEISQSAYKKFHSTETALLKVQSDILQILDSGETAGLVLLDLSVAFDTIDQETLISRLNKSFHITGSALNWYKSYLMGREQKVVIAGTVSETKPSKYGMPQGSVLGPKKYCTYTKPVGSIIKAHNIDYHIYADDTQLYIALKPGKTENAVRQLELCIDDVRKWMETNYLKLNKDKTEFIIFGSKSNLKKPKKTSTSRLEDTASPQATL